MDPSARTAPAADVAAAPAPDARAGADDQRAAILAAVDRANAAWTAASQTLDPTALNNAVAGQTLSDDQSELDSLRQQGHSRQNVNTAFTVTDVTLDAPVHATVHTRETWYGELYDLGSGRLVQRTPSATYVETYTVELQNNTWIVTRNDLQLG
jgi:hypothetical protein